MLQKEEEENLIKQAKIVTEADKLRAIEGLRVKVTDLITVQSEQNAIYGKILRKIHRNTVIHTATLILTIIVLLWASLKPQSATKKTQDEVAQKVDTILKNDSIKK